MKKMLKIFAVLLFVVGCNESQKAYNFVFETQDGNEIKYMLETAKTPREQAQGLMNRKSLDKDGGMIFVMHPVRNVAMWMKATQIPLDIIFIDPNGTIINIHENAEPLSEEHILSNGETKAVVEVNGGDVEKHGIKIGDKVKHITFGNLPLVVEPGKK